jgi:hypothetical protein
MKKGLQQQEGVAIDYQCVGVRRQFMPSVVRSCITLHCNAESPTPPALSRLMRERNEAKHEMGLSHVKISKGSNHDLQ